MPFCQVACIAGAVRSFIVVHWTLVFLAIFPLEQQIKLVLNFHSSETYFFKNCGAHFISDKGCFCKIFVAARMIE